MPPAPGRLDLPIGRRADDQPMNRLRAPALPDEFAGQIVQQLGMRGRRSGIAEVIGRGHDARGKMVLPPAIHRHPGQHEAAREPGWVSQPSQCQPAAGRIRASSPGVGENPAGLSTSDKNGGGSGSDLLPRAL